MYKSKFTTGYSDVYVSDRMSGKMQGFPSISTACKLNPYCLARYKSGVGICAHCFAQRTTDRYKDLEKRLEENFATLTSSVLPLDRLPKFKDDVRMCRFESFGDLATKEQAINYINIARVNQHVHFALWTKNPQVMAEALKTVTKPSNLSIVLSELALNKTTVFAAYKHRWPFIDKVFTVYTKDFIKEHNVKINCGAKSCSTCGLCYFNKSIKLVKEQLK